MAVEIVGSYVTQSIGQATSLTVHRTITRYEVWKDRTLVLRTVNIAQATRYAHEIAGEVRTVEQAGYRL